MSPSRPNKVELNALMNINYGVSDNLLVRRRRHSVARKRMSEGKRGRKRPRAYNDSERIVTLPLVARETGAIMRDSRSFASLGDRLFTYDSRKMNNLDRIGSFRSFRRLTVIRMKVKSLREKRRRRPNYADYYFYNSALYNWTFDRDTIETSRVECGKELFLSFFLFYNFCKSGQANSTTFKNSFTRMTGDEWLLFRGNEQVISLCHRFLLHRDSIPKLLIISVILTFLS